MFSHVCPRPGWKRVELLAVKRLLGWEGGSGRRVRKGKKKKEERRRKFPLISFLEPVGCDNSLNMDEASKRDDLPAVVVTKEVSDTGGQRAPVSLANERMLGDRAFLSD